MQQYNRILHNKYYLSPERIHESKCCSVSVVQVLFIACSHIQTLLLGDKRSGKESNDANEVQNNYEVKITEDR